MYLEYGHLASCGYSISVGASGFSSEVQGWIGDVLVKLLCVHRRPG